MKKTTAALVGAILIASTAHAQYQLDSILRDGVVGGVIGGVIGNNMGEGDSETGALIGAVSGVTNGVINRKRSYTPRVYTHQQPVYSTQPYPRVVNCVRHITYNEQVWVRPVYNYDVNGNPFVIRNGYWKSVRRSRTVSCGGCGSCR